MQTTEEQHTRGPWASEELAGSSMQTANGSRCVALILGPDGQNVADVCDSAGMSEAEARANALLLSAAPDMLAALAVAEGYLARRVTGTNGVGERDVLPRIRAALAKAEAA
jgi:hypothetical protein